jgi:phosphatidylserine decarboxylase
MPVFEGFHFLRQGLANALTTGAIWPSSRQLSQAMVDPAFDVDSPRGPLRILEVGAGVGPVTAEILARLTPDDTLDVVELNPALFALLEKRFANAVIRPNLHNVNVLEFHSPQRYHHIISGLPLANFPTEVVAGIYEKFFDLLEPGGKLIMFHHIASRELVRAFSGPKNRRRAKEVMQIEARLAPFVVGERVVVLNVPPSRVVIRRRPLEIPVLRLDAQV